MRTRIFTFSPVLQPINSLHKAPLRTLHITRSITSQNQPQPQFSSNYSPEQGIKDVSALLRGSGGKWELTGSGKGVERGFKFKTFKKTWVSFFLSIIKASRGVSDQAKWWMLLRERVSKLCANMIGEIGIYEHSCGGMRGQETPS